MRKLRQVVFWAHLLTGAAAAVVVLVMSVTGVLLTYQRQITAWADTRGLDAAPPSPGAERLPLAALLEGVSDGEGARPTSVKWYAAAEAPVEVAFGRERTLFVSAYTGAVLGEGSAGVRNFFRTVVAWHRWLGREGESRALGKAVTGASNLGFLFLVVSGFYLWWPRNWTRRAVRSVTLFRGGLGGKARDFNWHNVIGFWSAVPLFVVVFSGVVISYRWAGDLVYRLAGDTPPAAGAPGPPAERGRAPADRRAGAEREEAGGSAGLGWIDRLSGRAEEQVPGWRSIALQLPESAGGAATFAIDRGDGGQPQKRARLELDRASGEVAGWEPFASGTPGRRLRSLLRFAHTGEVGGLIGQTIAGLVSGAAVLLVWTGLSLTWRRFRGWRGRRAAVAPRRPRAREMAGSA